MYECWKGDYFVNKNFYLVDFNGETNDTILFNGTPYLNNHPHGMPFHTLAVNLTGGNLALPTTVFMDEKYLREVIETYKSINFIFR
jgi:hypothetical protein